jgi:hypothetical protein
MAACVLPWPALSPVALAIVLANFHGSIRIESRVGVQATLTGLARNRSHPARITIGAVMP